MEEERDQNKQEKNDLKSNQGLDKKQLSTTIECISVLFVLESLGFNLGEIQEHNFHSRWLQFVNIVNIYTCTGCQELRKKNKCETATFIHCQRNVRLEKSVSVRRLWKSGYFFFPFQQAVHEHHREQKNDYGGETTGKWGLGLFFNYLQYLQVHQFTWWWRWRLLAPATQGEKTVLPPQVLRKFEMIQNQSVTRLQRSF